MGLIVLRPYRADENGWDLGFLSEVQENEC